LNRSRFGVLAPAKAAVNGTVLTRLPTKGNVVKRCINFLRLSINVVINDE
jgi:hypothetical protein